MYKPAKKMLTTSVSLLLALLLFSCSSDSKNNTQDPLAAYKSQEIDWHDCDPGILGDSDNEMKELANAQKALGERLKCGTVTVPLDYDNPARGDLKIAVMRTAAGQADQRTGAIFFNPGGPGVDGLVFAAHFGRLWNKESSDPEASEERRQIDAELKKIGDRYDLIGFSPRGVGASTQLICASNEQLRPWKLDRSAQTVESMLYNARLIAETCLKNPITRYINTDQTARDMDLIRHLLGDQKLNYIGYSYGSWLGSWYAILFPERVGRMLLDSSMDISGDFTDAMTSPAKAHQLALDEILAPYAAENNATFELGEDKDYIATGIFNELTDFYIFDTLTNWMIEVFTKQGSLDTMLHRLKIAKVLQNYKASHPELGYADLKAEIPNIEFFKNQEIHKDAAQIAGEFINDVIQKYDSSRPKSLTLDSGEAVHRAVVCNDSPLKGDENFWIEVGDKQFNECPLFKKEGSSLTENPCIYWGGPSVTRPALSRANNTSEGILFLQASHDTRTIAEGAVKGFSQLSNASMIMVENEHAHGLFPYGTSCVDLPVLRYFNEGILPERETSCAGKAPVVSAKSGKLQKSSVAVDSTYEMSKRELELVEKIKSNIK